MICKKQIVSEVCQILCKTESVKTYFSYEKEMRDRERERYFAKKSVYCKKEDGATTSKINGEVRFCKKVQTSLFAAGGGVRRCLHLLPIAPSSVGQRRIQSVCPSLSFLLTLTFYVHFHCNRHVSGCANIGQREIERERERRVCKNTLSSQPLLLTCCQAGSILQDLEHFTAPALKVFAKILFFIFIARVRFCKIWLDQSLFLFQKDCKFITLICQYFILGTECVCLVVNELLLFADILLNI